MKKTLLVTGGTGSFGNAVVNNLINEYDEIRVFSRDEKKQDDMRKKYSNPKIKFYIGDVRDMNSLKPAIFGVDYIFHAAALKQVPSCEFFPMQAVKTNINGTNNVLNLAEEYGVKKVICLSTDKAAYPINAMGMSKALMEKIVQAKSRSSSKTIFALTRYGNVMGSRGSVIPLFNSQISKGEKITITDPEMTRFLMSLDDAVELVKFAFDNANSGDLFIHKAPASSIKDLAKAISKHYNINYDPRIIGIRHGEKMYETLCTKEEMMKAEDLGDYYRVSSDSRDLNYDKYFDLGDKNKIKDEFNSNNTKQLSVDQIINLLIKAKLL